MPRIIIIRWLYTWFGLLGFTITQLGDVLWRDCRYFGRKWLSSCYPCLYIHTHSECCRFTSAARRYPVLFWVKRSDTLQALAPSLYSWLLRYKHQEGTFASFSSWKLNYIEKADFQKAVHHDAAYSESYCKKVFSIIRACWIRKSVLPGWTNCPTWSNLAFFPKCQHIYSTFSLVTYIFNKKMHQFFPGPISYIFSFIAPYLCWNHFAIASTKKCIHFFWALFRNIKLNYDVTLQCTLHYIAHYIARCSIMQLVTLCRDN